MARNKPIIRTRFFQDVYLENVTKYMSRYFIKHLKNGYKIVSMQTAKDDKGIDGLIVILELEE